jgi:hypothetical protein
MRCMPSLRCPERGSERAGIERSPFFTNLCFPAPPSLCRAKTSRRMPLLRSLRDLGRSIDMALLTELTPTPRTGTVHSIVDTDLRSRIYRHHPNGFQ